MTELTYAWRALLRTPMFTTGVVVTLSLALAASIAAITIVDRVLLRPLPLRDADAIVSLMESDGKTGRRLPSYPTFRDWQARVRGMLGVGFTRGETVSLGEQGKRERAVLALVSPGFLSVVGISPLVGRAFAPDEERANGGGVALISEEIWGARYGRDRSAIGTQLVLDGKPVTIIGVVPTRQRYPEWAEIWVPIEPVAATSAPLQNRFLHVDSRTIGRLGPGTTIEAATKELAGIQATLSAEAPDPAGIFPSVQVTSLRDTILGSSASSLSTLGVAMGLVLLLACANVGGLVLLRMARREKAFAVRAALGAPFRTLVRQLVIESVMLATLAGAIGIGIASSVIGLVRATPALGVPRSAELAIDARVVAIAATVSLVVGVLIGLLPAWRLRSSLAAGARFGRGAVTA
ncbi:MAG: ABC transporter permease, partial [Cytophagaceae bacterium]|nr:ABC transporter permease [Gemmatimonadaceae bacterium]